MTTSSEAALDRLVELATNISGMPVATLHLMNDNNLLWLKSATGLEIYDLSSEKSFPDYTSLQNQPVIVSDTLKDDRFMLYSSVTGNPGIRSYVGIPLITNENCCLGTLCVFDTIPCEMNSLSIKALNTLSEQIIDTLRIQSSLQNLEHEKKKYAALLQISGDGVHIFDRQGNIVDINNKFCEMLGYTRQEMLAMNVADWDAGFSPAALKDKVQETFNTPDIFETRHRCKDGRIIDVEISAQPVWIEDQLYLWNASRDITARKLAETERERLMRIIEESPDFIGTADMQGRISYLNRAGRETVGLADNSDLSILEIRNMHPEWASRIILSEGIPTVLKHGHWTGETALLHQQNGTEIPVSQAILVHRDKQGNPQLLSTIIRNISESKAYELALQKAKETAEAASRTKTEFLSNISHELRTPLNAILGFSQLLKIDSTLNEQVKQQMYEIEQAGFILLDLVNDLIDLGRIESGKLNLSIESIAIIPVINNSLKIVSPIAQKYGIEIINKISVDENVTVLADYSRLRQVLINLLSNAIKYNRPQGNVTLTCQVYESNKLRISVTDTGIGIPSNQQKRLFNTFDRLGKEGGKVEGTGIGLVISRNIIEAMNGRIGFDSIEGKGSTFWVDLLMGIATELPVPRIDTVTAIQGIAQPNSKTAELHLLLAEDNPVNEMVALMILNKLGYTADVVDNGAKAVEAVQKGQYDLVLMDCQMPEMDGFEATRAIRETEKNSNRRIPIIAMTANAMEGDRDRCLAAGMDDYITKPIDIPHFQKTLDTWLGRRNLE